MGDYVAKVLKITEIGGHSVFPIDRDALEEFPEEAVILPDLAAEQGSEEEEEKIDPQAIRELIMAEAREEAARQIQEAYQEGLARGTKEGREAFDASIAKSADMLEAAAAAMLRAREEFLASLEPQVVELATLIAERVLQREVRTDPEIIHSTVKRALAKITDRQRLKVRVHPGDSDALREYKVALLEDFSGIEELEVEADGSISPGGCIVESELMQVDARLDALLANVLDALMD